MISRARDSVGRLLSILFSLCADLQVEPEVETTPSLGTATFIVLAFTDKDVYRFATANGHKLPNLVNVARLR
jgi:hypothetical protein